MEWDLLSVLAVEVAAVVVECGIEIIAKKRDSKQFILNKLRAWLFLENST
jgi:hypothetical protein